MAVNKVVYGSEVLIDLTGDTVTKASLLKDVKAHDKAGNEIVGVYEAGEEVENILENGFSSGDITYEDNGDVIIATNNTTGQILTKTIGDGTVTVVLTNSDSELGRLVRTYNDDYSVITSVNTYNGTTSVKTFDYENQTISLVVQDSSGDTVKSITKRLKA